MYSYSNLYEELSKKRSGKPFNSKVVEWYISEYEKYFKSTPSCVSCTLSSDWAKLQRALKGSVINRGVNMKNGRTNVPVNRKQIVIVDGVPRMLSTITDKEVIAYLTDKTKGVDVKARERMFSVLPKEYKSKAEPKKEGVKAVKAEAKKEENKPTGKQK